jgi:hypothetical protein
VLLALFALVVLYRFRAVSDGLQQTLDELDRTDPGWRLADIEASRTPVPDNENSTVHVKEALARMPKDWTGQKLDYLVKSPAPELLMPTTATWLEDELKPLAGALQAAHRLAEMPNGRFPIEYKLNPLTTVPLDQLETRHVAALLAYDVRRLAQEKDIKGAVRSCRAGLNCARAFGDEPLLVSQLARVACTTVALSSIERTLALGEPDLKDLEGLQRALEEEDRTNGLLIALRGERAIWHQVFLLMEGGELVPEHVLRDLGIQVSRPERNFPFIARYEACAEHPQLLTLLTEQVETAKKPLHEQMAGEIAFAIKIRRQPAKRRWIRALMPTDNQVGRAFRRHHASLRCLFVLVAAERYRRHNAGRWPESLEQLRPGFLAELPLDPFDGKALRYQRLADGVVAYSVGPDGSDDGGVVDRDNWLRPGTDWGFRLWDVPRRRQPPPNPPVPPPE